MEGTDFTFSSPLKVTFDTDVSEAAVTLTIDNPDAIYKGDRTFELQLENAVGGPITSGKDVVKFTIIDNGMAFSRL